VKKISLKFMIAHSEMITLDSYNCLCMPNDNSNEFFKYFKPIFCCKNNLACISVVLIKVQWVIPENIHTFPTEEIGR
jgi:hypothetical protein